MTDNLIDSRVNHRVKICKRASAMHIQRPYAGFSTLPSREENQALVLKLVDLDSAREIHQAEMMAKVRGSIDSESSPDESNRSIRIKVSGLDRESRKSRFCKESPSSLNQLPHFKRQVLSPLFDSDWKTDEVETADFSFELEKAVNLIQNERTNFIGNNSKKEKKKALTHHPGIGRVQEIQRICIKPSELTESSSNYKAKCDKVRCASLKSKWNIMRAACNGDILKRISSIPLEQQDQRIESPPKTASKALATPTFHLRRSIENFKTTGLITEADLAVSRSVPKNSLKIKRSNFQQSFPKSSSPSPAKHRSQKNFVINIIPPTSA